MTSFLAIEGQWCAFAEHGQVHFFLAQFPDFLKNINIENNSLD